MAYSITNAVTELKRGMPWLVKAVGMEPLEGLYDGVNLAFRLPVLPADSTAAVTFYNGAGVAVTHVAVSSYDTGAVFFDAGYAPTAVVYASYTALAIPQARLIDLARAGFDDMQSRWRRTLYLAEDAGVFYVSSSRTAVVDPQCGLDTFSQSRTQIDFLLACCEYVLIKALSLESAITGFSYREERVGGLNVDKTKQPAAFQALLVLADAKVEQKLSAVREEAGADDFGSMIPGAQSDEYRGGWEWWSGSKQARGL